MACERLHQQFRPRLPIRLPGGQLGRRALGDRKLRRIEGERRGRKPVQCGAAHILELSATPVDRVGIELRQVRRLEEVDGRLRVGECRRGVAGGERDLRRECGPFRDFDVHPCVGRQQQRDGGARTRQVVAQLVAQPRERRLERGVAPGEKRGELRPFDGSSPVRDEMSEQQARIRSESPEVHPSALELELEITAELNPRRQECSPNDTAHVYERVPVGMAGSPPHHGRRHEDARGARHAATVQPPLPADPRERSCEGDHVAVLSRRRRRLSTDGLPNSCCACSVSRTP